MTITDDIFEPRAAVIDDTNRYTDVGNARRLIAAHGHELRHVGPWDSWLVWDGARWKRDTKRAVVERAKDVAASLWTTVTLTDSTDEKKRIAKWAMESEGAHRIAAMVNLARSEPAVAVDPDELDRDPMLLNVANGTVDLRTGQLRPHDPANLITKMAGASYDHNAECCRWEAFLEQVVPDPDVRLFLQRAAGYTLTGSTVAQVLFLLYGPGANGKSVFFSTLLAALGDYGRQGEPDLLLARRDAHPTGLADLKGARLVVTSEIDDGRRLAEATVKQLTGGDRIKARYMRADFFEFEPTHKLWIGTNHRPTIRGTDHAIWRRIRLVPFNVTIPPGQQDAQLTNRLHRELPGILRWAVAGCVDWQQHGLPQPQAVVEATGAYRSDMDIIGRFIDERCHLLEFAHAPAAGLYHDYTDWCASNGEQAVSKKAFGTALAERGLRNGHHGSGQTRARHWYGIGLIDSPNLESVVNG